MKTMRDLLEELEFLVDQHGMSVMDFPVVLEPGSQPPQVKFSMNSNSQGVVIHVNWLER